MSTSEEFQDRQEVSLDEPACASPLDKEIAQPSPPGDVRDDGGGLVGGSPSSLSLSTQAHRRALEKKRQRILKELEEIREALFYLCWRESVPDQEVRPLGAALAKQLAARKQTFAPRSAAGNLNLGIAFLYLAAVDPLAYVLLAVDEPRKSDVRLLRREYWKIVGNPPSAAWVKGAQTRDRHRRRQRAMMAKGPARYIDVSSFPPQFDQALSAKTFVVPSLDSIEEILEAPDNTSDEVCASLEQQSLRALLQSCRALLAPKEQVAFDRMLNDDPPVDNAEACARQRVKGKLRDYFEGRHTMKKGTDADMSAAVANDLADLKLGQRMQGETLDEILRGVEALRVRDLELIDDEEDTGA
jgi:hypothetical protein